MPKSGNYSMMSKKSSSSSSSSPTNARGYTNEPSVASSSAKSIGRNSSAAPEKQIGCNSSNVYDEDYLVSRRFPGSISASMEQLGRLESNGGKVAAWTLSNPWIVQYRASEDPRGADRHGDVTKALVKQVNITYLNNTFMRQVLLCSKQLKGNCYTNDGERGLISVASTTYREFGEGVPIYLSPQIDNTFLRYANVDAKEVLRDRCVKSRINAEAKEEKYTLVPVESHIGKLIWRNSTLNDNWSQHTDTPHTIGQGPQYSVQLHPSEQFYDITPEQFDFVAAKLLGAAGSGRPIDMSALDIYLKPASGKWCENVGLEEFGADQRAVYETRNTCARIEFEIEVIYRLIGHKDMCTQSC